MRAGSFDRPPVNGKTIHQSIDRLVGVLVRTGGQVGIAGGGKNRMVTEDLLHFQQIDTGFDQMRGIAVT